MPPVVTGLPRPRTHSELTEGARLSSAIEITCYALLLCTLILVLSGAHHFKLYRARVLNLLSFPGENSRNPAQIPTPQASAHVAVVLEEISRSQVHGSPSSPPNPSPESAREFAAKERLHQHLLGNYPPPPLPPSPAYIEPAGKLRKVFVLMRNGDRTAKYYFPAFEGNYSWPGGLGQLTARGFQQGFKVGTELRRRYIQRLKLLDEEFMDKHQIEAWATKYARTIDTLNAVMLGMYPPKGGRQLSKSADCACRIQQREMDPVSPRCVASCVGYELPSGAESHLMRAQVHTLDRSRDWRLRASKVCHAAKATNLHISDSKAWLQEETRHQLDIFRLSKLIGAKGAWRHQRLCGEHVKLEGDGSKLPHKQCLPLGLSALELVWNNLEAASIYNQPKLRVGVRTAPIFASG